MNRLVVVSNRVPAPAAAGAQAGGLAVALDALMERRGGVWFGWSGKVVPEPASTPKIVRSEQVDYATIDLSPEENDRYYNGFSNGTLWPLLHSMRELMRLDRRNGPVYRAVNERFADALVPLLRPNDLVWIHDYHLMSLPALLRARRVHAPIGFFLHIPFPAGDILASVPEAEELVRDLLAADVLGFQTENDAANFADTATRIGAAVRGTGTSLVVGTRRVRLDAFPIEIEAREFSATAEEAWNAAPTGRLRRSLAEQKLILGVDRMDPTKGLVQRLNGYHRFLQANSDWRRRVTFLQIAAESRADVAAYQNLRLAIESEAGRINSEFSEPDWVPLRLTARAGARSTVAGYMREARVGLVTPLRDGMNLVAKEFVAAQNPQDPGVLILSRFAGAARQLDAALLVNPHDPDAIADALGQALTMPLAERQHRWRACWEAIADATALGWGRSFLAALLRASLTATSPRLRVAADIPGDGSTRSPAGVTIRDTSDPSAVPPMQLM